MISLQVGRARDPVAHAGYGSHQSLIGRRFRQENLRKSGLRRDRRFSFCGAIKATSPTGYTRPLLSDQQSFPCCTDDLQALERPHVGHDVFDLRRFQDFLERGHQRIAVFYPRSQGLVGDFIVVDGERSAF